MIHVYMLAVRGAFRESHGPQFMAKREELQAKVPFTIPLTDNVTDLPVSSHVTVKPVHILWATRTTGTPVFQFLPTKYGTDTTLQSTVHTTVQHHVNVEFIKPDAAIYTLTSPLWTKVGLSALIPRVYKVQYFKADSLRQKFPAAVTELEQATPVWSASPADTKRYAD